jgi:hypothetical protein
VLAVVLALTSASSVSGLPPPPQAASTLVAAASQMALRTGLHRIVARFICVSKRQGESTPSH